MNAELIYVLIRYENNGWGKIRGVYSDEALATAARNRLAAETNPKDEITFDITPYTLNGDVAACVQKPRTEGPVVEEEHEKQVI